MEKLQLKHLAPYLPYNIEVKNISLDEQCFAIGGISTMNIYSIKNVLNGKIKPILRPLSDLTKEIEFNTEKFIPIDWFQNEETNTDDYFDGNIWVEYLFNNENHGVEFIPYGMMVKLFEWHFDVFGLIDKGLAIDINTL